MRSDRYRHEKQEPQKRKKRSPLKGLLIFILLLAAAVAAAAVYSYKKAEDSLSISFTEDSPEVEFGSSHASMDYVKNAEGDVMPGSEFLDTGTSGSAEMEYTVSKSVLGGIFEPAKTFTLSYTVTDSTPPVVLRSGDGSMIALGSKFDIDQVISYGDNADPSPKLTLEGDVDTSSAGDYSMHAAVSDASGNTTEWDFTVSVVETMPSYPDTTERTSFSDFVSAYKADGRSFGIDVSEWQGDIDFEAVKAAGCEFVIIRTGYGSGDDITMDETFADNFKKARGAGLRTGVYVYSYDSSAEDARKMAERVTGLLEGEELGLPVVFDWEDFDSFQTYGISFKQLNDTYAAFAEGVTAAGYEPMLYGSKTYLENVWNAEDNDSVWLAHYTDETNYKGPYRLWQQSCTGRIDGIDGDVDMDILYD